MSVRSMSDNELISSYQEGNAESFGILISRYKDKVFSYLVLQTKDQHLAEDVFQDTFIKVMKSLKSGKYVEEGRFLSWVIRISHNLVIDYYRKQNQVKKIVNESVDYDLFNNIQLADGNVEDEIVQNQINEAVVKLVELLPDDQKEVVLLRHFGGLSFKEISDQTGVSINTALGRMRYALINLRRIIEEKQVSLTLM